MIFYIWISNIAESDTLPLDYLLVGGPEFVPPLQNQFAFFNVNSRILQLSTVLLIVAFQVWAESKVSQVHSRCRWANEIVMDQFAFSQIHAYKMSCYIQVLCLIMNSDDFLGI